MLINIDHLNFAYGIDDIFKDTSFQIKEKERVGLVGSNGIGKSTFIKLLTGELEPDSGNITIDKNISIGHLEQEIDFDQNLTLRELFQLIYQDYEEQEDHLRELEEKISLAKPDQLEKLYKEYDRLQQYLHSENIYSHESYIRGMIKGLNLSEDDLEKPFLTLSGGEKTRVILAMLLLRAPDLLILDEPTNFLDIQTLNWLENTLRSYHGSILLISHDRYFLNRICNRIVEIENYQLRSYPGTFDEYITKKEIERAEQNKIYALTLKEVQRQQNIIRRYRDINSKQSSKHARSREKQLAKLELPQQSINQRDVLFYFNPRLRSGEEVLKVTNLSKGYNSDPLFKNINFLIKRGDKVGLIGENGIGKTTLFNILRRKLRQDSGKFEYGSKVNMAFFDQESSDLREYSDFNLIEVIRESNSEMTDGEIRNFLANFLFTEDDVFKKVQDLSGGEKVRIKLAQLMLSNANFLIMDEPTNHIDMATKDILENVLINYQGTIFFISHDRYFLNRIANRIFEFTSNGINEYLGNYSDYLSRKSIESEKPVEVKPKITKTQLQKNRKKDKEFRRQKAMLQNEINTLEKEIETNESRISEIEELMTNPDFYKENNTQSINEYNQLKDMNESLTNQWEQKYLELEKLLEK